MKPVLTFLFLAFLFNSCSMKENKFVGLQLWSVRNNMKSNAEATLDSVGAMGYRFVEAAGYADGQFYGMDPIEFKNLCMDKGLQFLGSHTGQNVPSDSVWEDVMNWWDICIDAHKQAGVKWIVQPWMGKTGYESLEGLKRYARYFNAVGEKCNANGIRFGYHNHDKEFTTFFDGKPVYDWLLELTDPQKVMFQLDLYWIVEGGKDPLDYFQQYPGRFENWHLKDEKELGSSGMVDFETIFSQKDRSGMQYAVVEVEKYNFTPITSCRKSLEFIQEADYIQLDE